MSALLGLVTVPILAWVLTAADVGRFNVYHVLIPLVVTGVFAGLDQAFVREFHESKDPKNLQAKVLSVALILLSVLSILALPFASGVSQALFGLAGPIPALALILSLFLGVLIRLWTLVARMAEKPIGFSASQIAPRLLLVFVLSAALVLSVFPSFEFLLIVLILGNALSVIILAISLRRQVSFRWRSSLFSPDLLLMLRYGLPLALSSFAYLLAYSVGTFSVRYFLGFEELGRYALALSIAGAAAIVQSVFSVVWSPIIYRALAAGAALKTAGEALRIVTVLFVVVLSLVGAASWIVEPLLPEFYGNIAVLIVGLSFVPLVYMVREVSSVGIMISRRTDLALVGNLLTFVLLVGSNILLVPIFGVGGAVVSSVFAFWLLFVYTSVCSHSVWAGVAQWRTQLLVALCAALAIATVIVGPEIGFWYVPVWLLLLFLTLVAYRETVLRLARSFRR